VYEIVNSLGIVEHIGETNNTNRRWREHVRDKLSSGRGKFYLRQDIVMNVVATVETRKESRDLEEQLQLIYGLETDRMKKSKASSIGAKKVGKVQANKIHTCPHCGKIGKSPSMFRWHFDNCKTIRESDRMENQSLQDPSYLDPYHL